MSAEVWKPWPGDQRYELSDLGRVRSYARVGRYDRTARSETPRVLAQAPTWKGYLTVTVSGRKTRVHLMVLEAFVGPRPVGQECAHINGDPADNRLANLRWATKAENWADKRLHGTATAGERNPGAKLSAADVAAIRRLRGEGAKLRELAATFRVAVNTIVSVTCGRAWRSA